MNLIKLFFILLIITSFSGCNLFFKQNFDDRLVEIEEPLTFKEVTGILEKKEITLANKATHIVVDDKEIIIAEVKSSKTLLNTFNNKQVKITGFVEGNNTKIPVLEVEQIEEIIENLDEDNSDLDLATKEDWQTFIQDENRFSFKHPSSWEVILANQVIYLQDLDEDNIIKIIRFKNTKNSDITTFVSTDYEEITVNEYYAIKTNTEKGIEILFTALDEIIKISLLDLDQELIFYDFLRDFKIFEEIEKKQKCGGSENTLCPTGFICEIERGTVGTCIDINKKEQKVKKFDSKDNDLKNNNDKLEETSDTENFEIKDPLAGINPLIGSKYENKHMNFSLTYPQSWWFKSFGSTPNTLWHTEFANHAIENIGDGSIVVNVKNGARGLVVNKKENNISILIPRDSSSHFEISGNIEDEEIIQQMAKAVSNDS